ncbi:hypothetical protein BB560_000985 [Smittium megazygosporum]|uniref:Uncharacterized protein n=1 Tax=Smittium megazygosporum TaxID=133381 RepID=A0A2T9ZIU3_9FUNG|nr:hypothetical protein BB560_000985 [Smittium megazygosporum]
MGSEKRVKVKKLYQTSDISSNPASYEPESQTFLVQKKSKSTKDSKEFIFHNTNDFQEAFKVQNIDLVLLNLTNLRSFSNKVLKHKQEYGIDPEFEKLRRIVSNWDEASNHFSTLFEILDNLDIDSKQLLAHAMIQAFEKLLPILNDELLMSSGVILSRNILSKLNSFIINIFSSFPGSSLLSLLKLLSCMTNFNNIYVSNEIIKTLQSSNRTASFISKPKNAILDRKNTTPSNSEISSSNQTLSLYEMIILSVLPLANLNNKENMIGKHGLLTTLFHFLNTMDYERTCSLLSATFDHIFLDLKIKRKIKLDFFCGDMFDCVLNSFYNSDQVELSNIRPSITSLNLLFNTPNKISQDSSLKLAQDSIADLSFRFISSILCTRKFFVDNTSDKKSQKSQTRSFPSLESTTPDYFDSNKKELETAPFSNRVHPQHTDDFKFLHIIKLLTNKIKTSSSQRHLNLSLKVLSEYHEIIPSLWKRINLSLEPRLSLQFLINISYVFSVMSIDFKLFPGLSHSLNSENLQRNINFIDSIAVNSVVEYIVPSQFNKFLLSKGLQHTSSNLVRYKFLLIIGKSLQNLTKVENQLLKLRSYMQNTILNTSIDHSSKNEFIHSYLRKLDNLQAEIVQLTKARLPEWSVVLSTYRQCLSNYVKLYQNSENNTRNNMNQVSNDVNEPQGSKSVSIHVLLEIVLKIVSRYVKHFPDWVIESKFDLSKLLAPEMLYNILLQNDQGFKPNDPLSQNEQISTTNKFFLSQELVHILKCLSNAPKGQIQWRSKFELKGNNSEEIAAIHPKTIFGAVVLVYLSHKPKIANFAKAALLNSLLGIGILDFSSLYASGEFVGISNSCKDKFACSILDSLYFTCNHLNVNYTSEYRLYKFSSFAESVYLSFINHKYKYLDLTSSWVYSGNNIAEFDPSINSASESALFITTLTEKWIELQFNFLDSDSNATNFDLFINQFAKILEGNNTTPDTRYFTNATNISILFWIRELLLSTISVYGNMSLPFLLQFLTSGFQQIIKNYSESLLSNYTEKSISSDTPQSEISKNIKQKVLRVTGLFFNVMSNILSGVSNILSKTDELMLNESDQTEKPISKNEIIKSVDKISALFNKALRSYTTEDSKILLNDFCSLVSSYLAEVSDKPFSYFTQKVVSLYSADNQNNDSHGFDLLRTWLCFYPRIEASIFKNINDFSTKFIYSDKVFRTRIFESHLIQAAFNLNSQDLECLNNFYFSLKNMASNKYALGDSVFPFIRLILEQVLMPQKLGTDYPDLLEFNASIFSSIAILLSMKYTLSNEFPKLAEIGKSLQSEIGIHSLLLENLVKQESLSSETAQTQYFIALLLRCLSSFKSIANKNSFKYPESIVNYCFDLLADKSGDKKQELNHYVTLSIVSLPIFRNETLLKFYSQIQRIFEGSTTIKSIETFSYILKILDAIIDEISDKDALNHTNQEFNTVHHLCSSWAHFASVFYSRDSNGKLNEVFVEKSNASFLNKAEFQLIFKEFVSVVLKIYSLENINSSNSAKSTDSQAIDYGLSWNLDNKSTNKKITTSSTNRYNREHELNHKLSKGDDILNLNSKERDINQSERDFSPLDEFASLITSSAFGYAKSLLDKSSAIVLLKLLFSDNLLCKEILQTSTADISDSESHLFYWKSNSFSVKELQILIFSSYIKRNFVKLEDGFIMKKQTILGTGFSYKQDRFTNNSIRLECVHEDIFDGNLDIQEFFSFFEGSDPIKLLFLGSNSKSDLELHLCSAEEFYSNYLIGYQTWIQFLAPITEIESILLQIKSSGILNMISKEYCHKEESLSNSLVTTILAVLVSIAFNLAKKKGNSRREIDCVCSVFTILQKIQLEISSSNTRTPAYSIKKNQNSINYLLKTCLQILSSSFTDIKTQFKDQMILDFMELSENVLLDMNNNVNADELSDLLLDTVTLNSVQYSSLFLVKVMDFAGLTNASSLNQTVSSDVWSLLLRFLKHPRFLYLVYGDYRKTLITIVVSLWVMSYKLNTTLNRLQSNIFCVFPPKLIRIVLSSYNGSTSITDSLLLEFFIAYEYLTSVSVGSATVFFGYKTSQKLAGEQMSNYRLGYDSLGEDDFNPKLDEPAIDDINLCLYNLDAEMINKTIHRYHKKAVSREIEIGSTSSDADMKNAILDNLINKTVALSDLSIKSCTVFENQSQVQNRVDSSAYDFNFLVQLISFIVTNSDHLDLSNFIKKNLLGLAFYAISSHTEIDRALGYSILQKVYFRMLKGAKFGGRTQIRVLLQNLQASINEKNERIPYIISLFLANSAIILTKPDHSLYEFINNYILKGPRISLTSLPILIGSILPDYKSPNEVRDFVFRLVAFGSADYFADRALFQKFFVFEQLFSFELTPLMSSDLYNCSNSIIALFNLTMKHNSISLYHSIHSRDGLLASWINQRTGLHFMYYPKSNETKKSINSNFYKNSGSLLVLSRLILRILANSPTFLVSQELNVEGDSSSEKFYYDFYSFWVESLSSSDNFPPGVELILGTARRTLEYISSVLDHFTKNGNILPAYLLAILCALLDSVMSGLKLYIELLVSKMVIMPIPNKSCSKAFKMADEIVKMAEKVLGQVETITFTPPKFRFLDGFEDYISEYIIKSLNFESLFEVDTCFPTNLFDTQDDSVESCYSVSYLYICSSSLKQLKVILMLSGAAKNLEKADKLTNCSQLPFKESISRVFSFDSNIIKQFI